MESAFSAPGLANIALLRDAETRSISAENPTGEKSGGAKADPNGQGAARMLGKGWKVRPSINLKAESSIELARIEGPGVIQHIWMTVREQAYRDTVLLFYWDGETEPSVEVPLGDFFCNGHGIRCDINSLPIAVNPSGGFNSYWPMPFRKSTKITIENQSGEDIPEFFYQIDYSLAEVPDEAAYFHAQWRRSMTSREYPEHVMLDGVKGQGHFVGTYIAWSQFSSGWWGEGEVKFYIDGDVEYPTICGTGTEDYFGGAWCFDGRTYSTAFLGYPLFRKSEEEVPLHGLYRWHIYDPIRFKKDLKTTIQALGWWPNGAYEPLTDDIASAVFWYQSEPHNSFPKLPAIHERWSR